MEGRQERGRALREACSNATTSALAGHQDRRGAVYRISLICRRAHRCRIQSAARRSKGIDPAPASFFYFCLGNALSTIVRIISKSCRMRRPTQMQMATMTIVPKMQEWQMNH